MTILILNSRKMLFFKGVTGTAQDGYIKDDILELSCLFQSRPEPDADLLFTIYFVKFQFLPSQILFFPI